MIKNGIYRKENDKMQITEINIYAQAEKEGGTGNLEVVMHCKGQDGGFVCAQLLSQEGQEEDRIFPVPTEEEIDFCMQVPSVRLWDMERAYLYELVLELRDERMRLLGCTVKKLAFRNAKQTQEGFWLNGRKVSLHAWHCTEEELRTALEDASGCPAEHAVGTFEKKIPGCRVETDLVCHERRLRRYLAAVRRGHYNALSVERWNTEKQDEQNGRTLSAEGRQEDTARDTWLHEMLTELCPEYGLYYDGKALADSRRSVCVPDFALQVAQEGVLLENHCVFANVSEYELRYALSCDGNSICAGSLYADVPPGSGRYIELPFAALHEAGEYLYRASLHLKRDMPWAERGYEIAVGESVISNLFSG